MEVLQITISIQNIYWFIYVFIGGGSLCVSVNNFIENHNNRYRWNFQATS